MSAVLQRAQTGAIAALRPHLAPGLQKRAMQTTADGQLVQLGRSSIPLSTDSRLQRLTPDNEHMGSVQRLREALDKKGYLYLKQLQPRDKVRDLVPLSIVIISSYELPLATAYLIALYTHRNSGFLHGSRSRFVVRLFRQR